MRKKCMNSSEYLRKFLILVKQSKKLKCLKDEDCCSMIKYTEKNNYMMKSRAVGEGRKKAGFSFFKIFEKNFSVYFQHSIYVN